MGLFGGLPALKRPAEGQAAGGDAAGGKLAKLQATDRPAELSAADLEDLEELDEGANQAGVEECAAADGAEGAEPAGAAERQADGAPPPPPPPAPGNGDQVMAALRKIASHIGHPKKFVKASQLLRELLSQGAVTAKHGPLLFSCLKAAMVEPGRAAEPLLAREYSKLFTAASKVAEVFSVREKNQLEVFGSWAVLRNQLITDDSFQFNKVVLRLKEMASALPEASEEDEGLAERLAAAAAGPDPVLAGYDKQQAEAAAEAAAGPASNPAAAQAAAQPQQEAAPAAADPEADPFGLDALMEQQEAAEAAAAEAAAAAAARQPKSQTWSSGEVVSQRRAALLDCLDTAKACYRHMWARTSVDLLIEHCHHLKDRFLPSQRPRLDALMGFVRDQRRVRRLGPSAKEVNRDSTAFDRARAEWSKADFISHRGKVGGGGDRGAEAWLG